MSDPNRQDGVRSLRIQLLIGLMCVAMLVYLVDVRKRVDDIQGKSWFSKRA